MSYLLPNKQKEFINPGLQSRYLVCGLEDLLLAECHCLAGRKNMYQCSIQRPINAMNHTETSAPVKIFLRTTIKGQPKLCIFFTSVQNF